MKTTVALLVLLTAAGTAMAQRGDRDGMPPPPQKGDFVARLDANQDGKVSADEFDGPAEHFAELDQNGDGYLVESEAPGPRCKRDPAERSPRGEAQEEQGQRPPRGEEMDENPQAKFMLRLDADRDGQVSADEFDGPEDHFAELDKNGDGYITADEAPAGPPPRKRH